MICRNPNVTHVFTVCVSNFNFKCYARAFAKDDNLMDNSQHRNSGAVVAVVTTVQTIPHVLMMRKTGVSLPVFLYTI